MYLRVYSFTRMGMNVVVYVFILRSLCSLRSRAYIVAVHLVVVCAVVVYVVAVYVVILVV